MVTPDNFLNPDGSTNYHELFAEQKRFSEGLRRKTKREYEDLCLYFKDRLEAGETMEELLLKMPGEALARLRGY